MKTTGAVDMVALIDVLDDDGHVECTIPARLVYDPADPYAMTLIFPAAHSGQSEDVVWCFARSLLADVFTAAPTVVVGLSDVRLWVRPCGERVVIALSSPEGDMTLEASRVRLHHFARRSYGLVPKGAEAKHLDLDAELARLLRGTPVLHWPNGDRSRDPRIDVIGITPFQLDGVLMTRLASDFRHVPVAHLEPHPIAAEITSLPRAEPDDLDFPPPNCSRCHAATYHDGDGFVCPHCYARWPSSGINGVYPCVECGSREAEVTGDDGQPRCILCETEVRAGELEPTAPYKCRNCRDDVHGIGPETRSRARENCRCGVCQEWADNRETVDRILAESKAKRAGGAS